MRSSSLAIALGLALVAGCGAPTPAFVSVLGPESTRDTVGPYRIEAYVDAPDGVHSLVCRWVTGDDLASYAELPLALEGDDESGPWAVELPGQPAGSVVFYYLVLVDDSGALVRYPARAPDVLLGFRILTTDGD